MNLFFWKNKKYDKDLEMYLEQSRLYPYLQEGLKIIDSVLSGEIHFVHETHIKRELEHCNIDFWFITDSCIRLVIFTKRHDIILEIKSTEYTKTSRDFDFTLNLPINEKEFEVVRIEKTKIYEEFRNKIVTLHNPNRFEKTNNIRTKTLLKQDAQKYRLEKLVK